MAASIILDNVPSRTGPRARVIKAAIEGKSYLSLSVGFAPVGGSFNAIVSTENSATEAEVTEMAISLLIDFATDALKASGAAG